MHAPVEDFSTGGLTQAWLLLSTLETLIEERKKSFRERLLTDAEKEGKTTVTGSFKLNAEGNTVLRERRETKKFDDKEIMSLLLTRGLTTADGCDAVTTWVANPSKLANLVASGKLLQEDLDKLVKVTWALKVTASEQFDAMLTQLKSAHKQLK